MRGRWLLAPTIAILLASCSASPTAAPGSDADAGTSDLEVFCDSLDANKALMDEVFAIGDTGGSLDGDISTPHATADEMLALVPTFTNMYNAATVMLESAPDDIHSVVESLQYAADDAVFSLPQGDEVVYTTSSASFAIAMIREWSSTNCA